jgi:hypothetical protein
MFIDDVTTRSFTGVGAEPLVLAASCAAVPAGGATADAAPARAEFVGAPASDLLAG